MPLADSGLEYLRGYCHLFAVKFRQPNLSLLKLSQIVFGATVLLAWLNLSAQTVAIPGLYNTGVDDDGKKLGNNAVDTHYVVTAKPPAAPADNLGNAYTVRGSAIPGAWVGNPSDSRWITTPGTSTGGGSNGNDPARVNGVFDFTLSFNMPAGAILSTVAITGSGWADDSTTITVNGTLVSGQQTGTYFGAAGSFSLNSSNATFLAGSNTITFRVNNSGGGPTGLLINSLSGTVSVPEVGAVLPIFGAIALYGLVIWRRRSGVTTSGT